MVPDVEPPTGAAVGVEPLASPAAETSPALVTGPGYFAIACAGVAPFMTASVRAISTLGEPSPEDDDAAEARAALASASEPGC